MKRTGRKRTAGFTIVELMLGMLCAVVILLAIVVVLYGFYTAWFRDAAKVQLQRDAHFITEIVSRTVRPAAYASITNPVTSDTPGSRLAVSNMSLYVQNGSNLMYRLAGNDVAICNISTPTPFSKNSATQSVTTVMALQNKGQTLQLNFTVNCRNP